MTWDAAAQNVAVNVIGTVESNLAWDSVNYNDPITIGIAQWYGTRAASLLFALKAVTPSIWTGEAASIDTDMNAHPATDTWWNYRYLNRAEGESLMPILRNGASTQQTTLVNDLNGYQTVATAMGMDTNANTKQFIFFCTMYHQSPQSALEVMATAGPNASLDRYLAVCLNHYILGQYPSRYNTAYTMINAYNSTVAAPVPSPNPNTGGSSGGVGANQPSTDVLYLSKYGNSIGIHYNDGTVLLCHPSASTTWQPAANANLGSVVPPAPAGTPTNPPSGSQTTGQALVAWAASQAGAFQYGQGPGRLSPLKASPSVGNTSGYTDCSGFCYYAYMAVTGKNIGTWGGEQIRNGTLIAQGTSTIDTTNMQVGDLVFYEWSGGDPVNYDHTAMYAGNNQVWSHGGPGAGPVLTGITGFTLTPVAIMARRYI